MLRLFLWRTIENYPLIITQNPICFSDISVKCYLDGELIGLVVADLDLCSDEVFNSGPEPPP